MCSRCAGVARGGYIGRSSRLGVCANACPVLARYTAGNLASSARPLFPPPSIDSKGLVCQTHLDIFNCKCTNSHFAVTIAK
eukprot:11581541-Ditylum_brightwellii.AAC.1